MTDELVETPNKRRIGAYIRKDIRKQVMERDNKQCKVCHATEYLQIDHIVPVIKNGSSELDNLQVLCKYCNACKYSSKLDIRSYEYGHPIVVKELATFSDNGELVKHSDVIHHYSILKIPTHQYHKFIIIYPNKHDFDAFISLYEYEKDKAFYYTKFIMRFLNEDISMPIFKTMFSLFYDYYGSFNNQALIRTLRILNWKYDIVENNKHYVRSE